MRRGLEFLVVLLCVMVVFASVPVRADASSIPSDLLPGVASLLVASGAVGYTAAGLQEAAAAFWRDASSTVRNLIQSGWNAALGRLAVAAAAAEAARQWIAGKWAVQSTSGSVNLGTVRMCTVYKGVRDVSVSGFASGAEAVGQLNTVGPEYSFYVSVGTPGYDKGLISLQEGLSFGGNGYLRVSNGVSYVYEEFWADRANPLAFRVVNKGSNSSGKYVYYVEVGNFKGEVAWEGSNSLSLAFRAFKDSDSAGVSPSFDVAVYVDTQPVHTTSVVDYGGSSADVAGKSIGVPSSVDSLVGKTADQVAAGAEPVAAPGTIESGILGDIALGVQGLLSKVGAIADALSTGLVGDLSSVRWSGLQVAITDRFPFSLPWDVKRAVEGLAQSGELRAIPAQIYGPSGPIEFELQWPEFVKQLVPFVRGGLLFVYGLGLLWGTKSLLGGAE